jgi:hypothetical protein
MFQQATIVGAGSALRNDTQEDSRSFEGEISEYEVVAKRKGPQEMD